MQNENTPQLLTRRLILRGWHDADLASFAVQNSDPEVMEFLGPLLSRQESDARAERIRSHFEKHGFGLWAIEVPGVAPFIGFTGLNVTPFDSHFTPCVEIGWRLARHAWGQGYATEAAREAVRFAFEELALDSIVSFTVPNNRRSRSVMERLGMTHNPADDFDHPLLAAGHPLRRHVLYRLQRP